MSGEVTRRSRGDHEVSAGAFKHLLEVFTETRVPLATDATRAAAEHRRQQLKLD